MRAGELCIRDVVTAEASESAVDAARLMATLHVGDIIIIERRRYGWPRPIGIVTDRDLVVQVLAHPERRAADTKIADVMRQDLVTGFDDEDVETIVARMREHSIRRIPIVDRDGGLQGIITLDDVMSWLGDELDITTKLLERQGRGPLDHAR